MLNDLPWVKGIKLNKFSLYVLGLKILGLKNVSLKKHLINLMSELHYKDLHILSLLDSS